MTKRRLYSNLEQVNADQKKIEENTEKQMDDLLSNGRGLAFFRKLKFHSNVGYDPLFEEKMNFLEEVNQLWTYLVCLNATEKLLIKYPEKKFWVNFGTEDGHDVESEDDSVICECFATTNPKNNNKLRADINKVSINQIALDKYVIFFTENREETFVENQRNKHSDITVISLHVI